MSLDDALDRLLVTPGTKPRLARRDTADTLGLADKEAGESELERLGERLADLQYRLWAERRRSVLLVLQGMDASGKDGTIRRVMVHLNPAACSVSAFARPTTTELAHDYLWRIHAECPPRGHIGVFNRSHYEDLVTVKVLGLVGARQIGRRLEHVRAFERMLSEEGTTIVKCFLHISPAEQLERFRERITDPTKNWKFAPEDIEARVRWADYQAAYESALAATSTEWAPWHVIPADRKWARNVAVAGLLARALQAMRPRVPPPPADLARLRTLLEG